MKIHWTGIVSIAILGSAALARAAVTIEVHAGEGRRPISPALYGRNGSGVSNDPNRATTDADLFLTREAGLRATRETGGNNQTKYNWRKKLSSHPDWYNNVYAQSWDFSAQEMLRKLPGVQGMFGFQLLGWVASTGDYNFDAWAYNQSQVWHGTGQNLAGGGGPNVNGNVAIPQGDARKYLEPWPADSSAAILKHWFAPGGLGLDSNQFRYWGMDNELEIWHSTHDDVDSLLTGHRLTPEETVQRWAAVAKAARKLFPGVKLAGPSSPSEWQWYTWPDASLIPYKGATYCWPEYLIKRLAEIQDSTGVRMLDVYDVHLYLPGTTKEVIQQHFRLFWDTTYLDPNANAVRFAEGNWNGNQKRQMFFKRVQDWCDKHFGKGHGITVGATESGLDGSVANYPSEVATWYASLLGTFADNGAEILMPWNWHAGMWEVVHLFSRYGQADRVKSVSSLDSLVSAYSSISKGDDSLTVIVVNRGPAAQSADISLSGFVPVGGGTSLRLSGLTGETFVSHTRNALQKGTVSVTDAKFSADLPGYSITAYQFRSVATSIAPREAVATRIQRVGNVLELVDGPDEGAVELRSPAGVLVSTTSWNDGRARLGISGLPAGIYSLSWSGASRKVFVSSR